MQSAGPEAGMMEGEVATVPRTTKFRPLALTTLDNRRWAVGEDIAEAWGCGDGAGAMKEAWRSI